MLGRDGAALFGGWGELLTAAAVVRYLCVHLQRAAWELAAPWLPNPGPRSRASIGGQNMRQDASLNPLPLLEGLFHYPPVLQVYPRRPGLGTLGQ